VKSLSVRLTSLALLPLIAALLFVGNGRWQDVSAAPPAEFENLPLISGLNEPISFRFAPGGHILISEKSGTVRVFHMDGTEEPVPFMTLPVGSTHEQGLLALELDPNFAVNGDFYVYYTTPTGFARLSKFKSLDGGHTADPNSEVVLLQSDVPSDTAHHGGEIRVGADDKIYLTIGDNLHGPNAQTLENLHGKVLRVNKDGTIPADNPFVGNPAANDAVWAYGLRNPFRFTLLPNGKPLVADVGEEAFEEINIIEKGANYGWPIQEGECSGCPYANPAFSYPHTEGWASVTGVAVFQGNSFGPQYDGAVFYGDYVLSEIRYLVFDENYETVISDHEFEPDAGTVVDMHQGPDGNLYYSTIYPGGFYKIAPSGGNRSPVVQATADPTAGLLPLNVNFSSAGTYDPDGDSLSYLWDFGDGTTSTDPNPTHQYTAAPSAIPPADTVGLWKFDEPPGTTTAADSSGNGYHGTLVNMNAATAWVPGVDGGAISFDGLNDYVSTAFTGQLPNWTVAFWVKSPAAPTDTVETSVMYRGLNFHHHWNHPQPDSRNAITLSVGGVSYFATFGPLQPDTWYHLAGTYDGEVLKAYTDGVLTEANAAPYGPPDAEIKPLLFANHNNNGSFFNGTVDEARLYGRSLSPQEIRSLAGSNIYEATLTVSDSQKTAEKVLEITVGNEPPTPTISAPVQGSNYNAGDIISFSGSATDPQNGVLPATSLSWKVVFHHDTHIHPYLGPIQGQANGTFAIATNVHNGPGTWYRVEVTATDFDGLQRTVFKDIYPNLSELTIQASPPGAQFTVDGHPHNGPFSEQAVVGVQRVLHAPSPQFIGGQRYKFAGWSDGGAQTHTISTPAVDTTYTATYVPMPFPPPPWTSTDVGDDLPGSAEYSGGVFTVTGAGDIWANDDFHYTYQTMNGDGEIVARVTSQTNSHEWAKAGVMIKESAVPFTPYAMMSVTPGNGYAFQHHFNTTISGGPYTFPNAWVKLARVGNGITAFASADGATWNQVGATSVPMAEDVTVGLFVASHNPTATSTVTFDNVTVTDYPPPDPPPPPPWVSTDIGSPLTQGFAQYNTGVFTVRGAGTDIWGPTDEFHYVYQPLSGDGEIVARVTSQTPTDVWAKAGVMIKESATPGAPYALLAVTPANGYAFQHSVESNQNGNPYAFPNAWMKLTRNGNTFEVSTSSDGNAWTVMGSATIPMATEATVGLFVNSHNWASLGTVTFDNVTVTDYPPPPPPPWVSTDVGSPVTPGLAQYAGGVFTLYGAGSDIWGPTDEFRYVYQSVVGDGDIIARVTSQSPSDPWAKAGVMIKQSATAGAPYALLAVTPANGYAFQHSVETNNNGDPYTFPNAWMKLTRSGSTISAFKSADGTNWTLIGSGSVPMSASVTAGMFVTSHNWSVLGQVTFDNVSLTMAPDLDGDAVPDASDNCPAWSNPGQAPPPWTVPAGDADCDGFTAAREAFLGTDPTKHCAGTPAPGDETVDSWPTDFNDSQTTSVHDLVLFGPTYNKQTTDAGYNQRFNLNGDNIVSLADVVMMGPFYNKNCTQ
jgi:glucose/arabinose dehydrogenase/regulation of enolase protein 1 (concanavalin A-like superfamily)